MTFFAYEGVGFSKFLQPLLVESLFKEPQKLLKNLPLKCSSLTSEKCTFASKGYKISFGIASQTVGGFTKIKEKKTLCKYGALLFLKSFVRTGSLLSV